MSIYEEAIKVVAKNIVQLTTAWSDRIIHSNLQHAEYLVARTTYNVLKDISLIVENAINLNPDEPLPDSFIPSTGTPDPEVRNEDPETTVHTVDIESGTVSHGSH